MTLSKWECSGVTSMALMMKISRMTRCVLGLNRSLPPPRLGRSVKQLRKKRLRKS